MNNSKWGEWIRGLDVCDKLFLSTLFFTVLEQGLPLRISILSPYKVTLALLIGVLLCRQYYSDQKPFRIWKANATRAYRPVRIVIVAILIYLLFDLFSLLYTAQPIVSLVKYVSILPMSLLFLYLPIFFRNPAEDQKKLGLVVAAIALPSVIMLAVAALSLLIQNRTYYILKVSLIHDYNKFAYLLTLGFLCLLYFLYSFWEMPEKNRYITLYVATYIYFSFVLFTASRRGPLLFQVVCIAASFYGLMRLVSLKPKRVWLWGILHVMVVAGIFFAADQTMLAFDRGSLAIYEEHREKAIREGDSSFEEEKSLALVLDEIGVGALNKREEIWSIAIDAIKSFNAREILLGRGGSYHYDLYNTPENRARIVDLYTGSPVQDHYRQENSMDPHNFLLTEMLNGGIVKLGVILLIGIAVLVIMLRMFPKNYFASSFLILYGVILLLNILISSKHGMLENKDTWILLLLLTIHNMIYNEKGQVRIEKRKESEGIHTKR